MNPETEDDIGATFSRASGASSEDCLVVAQRFREAWGVQPPDGESWLVRQTAAQTVTVFFKRGWYTGLWTSPTGAAFLSDANGAVHRLPPGASSEVAGNWVTDSVNATVMGVWGLSDEHVFAWGLAAEARPAVFGWSGRDWRELPPLEERVIAMHGLRADAILAVGEKGLVAIWNGSRWTRMGGVSQEITLGSVHVVSDEEIYAGSPDGALYQGSLHGWTAVYDDGEPVGGLAHWQGELWVGSLADSGLSKLAGRQLQPVKPALRALSLEARDELLLCTMDAVISTPDGVAFRGRLADDFAALLRGKALAF